jgi:hypothetical protein
MASEPLEVMDDAPTMCARHPGVETELRCSRCETPICARCMVHTPVGARCRDCAQVRRIPTYNMSSQTFARAIGAALVGGAAVGIAWGFFNIITYVFFGLIGGLAVGFAVGELVSVATNRKAGPPLQAVAVGGVIVAYLVRLGLLFAIGDWVFEDVRTDIYGIIVAGIAAFVAAGRLR